MNPLISLGIAPFSWRLGIVRSKPGKVVIGLGPLRLSLHDLSEVGDQAKLDYRTDERFVSLTYTNHRGETALRTIKPVEAWYGESPYHRGAQWFLRAFDMEKGAERDFALLDIGVPSAAVHYNAGVRAGRIAVETGAAEPVERRVKVPEGQTPLDDSLHHPYLDVIREGEHARETGTPSPYHGHSLEHCLHATGWVSRDLRMALDACNAAHRGREREDPKGGPRRG